VRERGGKALHARFKNFSRSEARSPPNTMNAKPAPPRQPAPPPGVLTLPLLLPGLTMACLIAGAAFAARQIPYVSLINPIVLAVAFGMALSSVFGVPMAARPGLEFAARSLLRISIVLLGLQITFAELVQVGAAAIIVCAVALIATFVFTKWLGRLLGVDAGLTELLASGTAVCGASAIVATNTVTRAPESDVAYALGSITLFGTLSIILYPIIMQQSHLPADLYGFWAGASIHEVAQVVAAAFQGGPEAGNSATIVKLARVLMLAPLIIAIGFRQSHDLRPTAAPVPLLPWFIVGFVALVAFGSMIEVPPNARQIAATTTSFLFAVALAALGLSTHLQAVTARGWKPLVVGAGAWIFIASVSMACIVAARMLGFL
jgi:uncharacterized integral membrane protein (TIGR00698 family)